ncbi:MAG: hypothetical protein RL748_2524 [Pseudomonadota bacterium]|jgi:hypothetical protein
MNINNQHSAYESEFTLFLKDLKKQKPDLEEKQRQGRALLWDKSSTPLEEQQARLEATVKQQAYVYQNKL